MTLPTFTTRQLPFLTKKAIRCFKVDGPAKISFSGGRTSALMLYMTLLAHDGKLPDDVHVLFANTGKEREETLEFVRDVGKAFGVPITWVERSSCSCAIGIVTRRAAHFAITGSGDLRINLEHGPECMAKDPDWVGYRHIDFDSASRHGEPFAALIEQRNYLPNPVTRLCTEELKIRVMKKWMVDHGHDHWTNVIGLRADEPNRVARMRSARQEGRWDVELPLADAGITQAHVDAFWAAMPFDLHLRKWEGNCDPCFLKGRAKRTRIMRDKPELAPWWIMMESVVRIPRPGTAAAVAKLVPHVEKADAVQPAFPGMVDFLERVIAPKVPRASSHPFRIDAPRYADLFAISQQPMLNFDPADLEGTALDDIGDCFCNAA